MLNGRRNCEMTEDMSAIKTCSDGKTINSDMHSREIQIAPIETDGITLPLLLHYGTAQRDGTRKRPGDDRPPKSTKTRHEIENKKH